MSKIGIFGGSFNPIHNGHIYIVNKVKSMLGLDDIIFIPTGIAPHKDNCDFASKEHRFNMVKLAVDDKFQISDIEIKSDKVCYAVDTMSEINKIYKNDDNSKLCVDFKFTTIQEEDLRFLYEKTTKSLFI